MESQDGWEKAHKASPQLRSYWQVVATRGGRGLDFFFDGGGYGHCQDTHIPADDTTSINIQAVLTGLEFETMTI